MIDRWDSRPYFERLGDALSQFVNVALANGMPDESLSGRSWRNTALHERDGLPVKWRWRLVRAAAEALFWRAKGQHCRLAFEQDIDRAFLRSQAVEVLT